MQRKVFTLSAERPNVRAIRGSSQEDLPERTSQVDCRREEETTETRRSEGCAGR